MESVFQKSESLLSELSQELKTVKHNLESSSINRPMPLHQLKSTIDAYCSSNSLKKKDLAMLANISSTTLTAVLKNPENAKVSTIISICQVIGIELSLTRG